MGYSETKKGYILLDLTNKKFFVHREVIFREDVFPFKAIDHHQYQLFPSVAQQLVEEDYNTTVVQATTQTAEEASDNVATDVVLASSYCAVLRPCLKEDPAGANNLLYVLSIAASRHWHIHQMDVFNAFLQGDLEDEMYMSLPHGFQSQGETGVCRLSKSLYGLKQTPRQ